MRLRQCLQQLGRDRALAVVGDDEDVGVGAAPQHEVAHAPGGRSFRTQAVAIDPHDLLLVGHDPRLLGGRDPARDDHAVGARTEAPQCTDHLAPRSIASDDAARGGATAERRHVADDVAGAAGAGVVGGHPHHRHGRLGRDAVDPSPDERIQHEIADDQHAHPAEAPYECGQATGPDGCHDVLS